MYSHCSELQTVNSEQYYRSRKRTFESPRNKVGICIPLEPPEKAPPRREVCVYSHCSEF